MSVDAPFLTSVASQSRRGDLLPPSPPQAPPTPSITTSSSTTPDTLAKAIAADLSSGNLVQTAATLAAISTDSLRQNADTVIERLEPFLALPRDVRISRPEYHKPTPPFRYACRIRVTHQARILTLNFARAHNKPWRLTSLDSG